MHYSDAVADALVYAFSLHQTQTRKGSGVPYVTHLLAVAALVGEHGGDESQFIAALLHDAPEDQGGEATLARIRARFGPEVADIVAACSDTFVAPKPPWRERKEAHIAKIAGAEPHARLVAAADKLHNAASMLRDWRVEGEALWGRFRGGKEGTLWYFRAMHGALAQGWTHPILDELDAAVRAVEACANHDGPG